jgi:tetratricopeptide (TPR) repeat protein
VHSPYDLLARVLLSDRAEIMRYTQIEQRTQDGRLRAVPASTNVGPCAAPACVRTPSPLNTDDNARIEFAAPRDLIGFERYKGYLQTIYAESWPFGQLRGRVRGLDAGAEASENHAELAMALLAHGRKRESSALLEQAVSYGPSPQLRIARAMLDALKPDALDPPLRLRAPTPDASIGVHASQRIIDGYAEVMDWLARSDVQHAKAAMQALPSSLVRYAGPDLRFLRGYVLYRARDYDRALGELEAIARSEPGFVLEHPELYYFLGRAHDALLHFDKAVRSIRVYVQGAVLFEPSPQDALPEPAPQAAPITDAPGESDKLFRRAAASG